MNKIQQTAARKFMPVQVSDKTCTTTGNNFTLFFLQIIKPWETLHNIIIANNWFDIFCSANFFTFSIKEKKY